MGMGQHKSRQTIAAFDDKGRVRHYHIDTGHSAIAEGDAEIDHHPGWGIGRAVTV